MVGVVHHGAGQHVEAHIGTAVQVAVVFFYSVHCAQNDAAFSSKVATGFDLKQNFLAIGAGKVVEQRIQLGAQRFQIQTVLGLLIGHTKAAAQIDELQIGEGVCNLQQGTNALQIRFLFQKEGADVLVNAHQFQIIFGDDFFNLGKKFRINGKLSFFAAGNYLIAVTGAHTGVNADANGLAGKMLAEGFQLRYRVDADNDTLIHCISHFFHGYIVTDVENLIGGETSLPLYVDLTGGHGIGAQTLFTGDLQQGQIAIGLYAVVDLEVRVGHQIGHFAAAGTEHPLVVYINRAAVFFHKLEGANALKKVGIFHRFSFT